MLDNEVLLDLFNRCLRLQGASRLWFINVLIGVLKPRKRGPVSDWMRMLYSSVTYVVWMGGELMRGDNGSPGLWKFYSSDLEFSPHLDDVWIAGRQVRNLEQADDGAIFSSAGGVQTHLDVFGPWTCRKALRVNIQKTKVPCCVKYASPSSLTLEPYCRLWSLVAHLLLYQCLGCPVQWTNLHKYLGVTFTSSHANVFKAHYGIKSKATRKIAAATFTR